MMPATATAARTRAHARRTLVIWTLVLVAAFLYRLGYGLCADFFSDDETQIFLIGLRYAAGAWPYFGADIVWTQSQIPGALQGVLVGLPLRLVAVPEAPFVLLNLLSLAALGLLAWYIGRRLPSLPRWLLWGWLLFVPWTLEYSTHLMNPDYVLAGGIVFFVGFFEAHPRLRLSVIGPGLAHAMMGAGVCWVMQLHMSWPLLGPFVLVILWYRLREGLKSFVAASLTLAAGCALTFSLLAPTFWTHGIAGLGGTHRNLHFQIRGAGAFLTTLGRMLSFPSMETLRFMQIDTPRRLQLLADHVWLAPLAAIMIAAGIAQPVWMFICWFRRSPHRDWRQVRTLFAAAILLVYLSYAFVMEPPQARAFYVLAPLCFIYAAYCWTFLDAQRWRIVAAVVLATSIAYHGGLALVRGPARSMYKNRAVVAAAVREKNPNILGHRRPYAIEGAPRPDPSARFGNGDPRQDLRLVSAQYSHGIAGIVLWTVTVRNDGGTTAYRDVYYTATYRDGNGRPVASDSAALLGEILQPGQTVTVTGVNHGFKPPFASADLRIDHAEGLWPLSYAAVR